MASKHMTMILFSSLAIAIASGQASAQGKRSYASHHFELQLDSARRAGGVLAGAKMRAPRHSVSRRHNRTGNPQLLIHRPRRNSDAAQYLHCYRLCRRARRDTLKRPRQQQAGENLQFSTCLAIESHERPAANAGWVNNPQTKRHCGGREQAPDPSASKFSKRSKGRTRDPDYPYKDDDIPAGQKNAPRLKPR